MGTISKNKKVIRTIVPSGKIRSRSIGYVWISEKYDASVVSSLHRDYEKDLATGKPEIIMDYNSSEGDVDIVDVCLRLCKKCLKVVLYPLVNLLGNNTIVIHKCSSFNIKRRREFLQNLAHQLVKSHLLQRTQLSCLTISLALRINWTTSSTGRSRHCFKKWSL